jgi:hypothetical protein
MSYFLDIRFKSYGYLKIFGEVRATQKKLFFNFLGLDFFHKFIMKFLIIPSI